MKHQNHTHFFLDKFHQYVNKWMQKFDQWSNIWNKLLRVHLEVRCGSLEAPKDTFNFKCFVQCL